MFLSPQNIHTDFKYNINKIACHLSHMKTLEKFLDSKNNICLILEDDIKMKDKENTLQHLKNILKHLPKDWEYINLGRCWDYCDQDEKINEYIIKSKRALCRHAYIVNKKGAKKILDYCLPMKNYPGDVHYVEIINKKLLNGYSSKKSVFFQNRQELGSYLGNNKAIQTCVSK